MEPQPNTSKTLGLVVGINLAVLLAYSVGMYFLGTDGSSENLSFLIGMMVSIALHCVACLIASIVFFIIGRNNFALAFLLSTFVVGIVGFSLCYGGSSGEYR
jgi:hypothetical protein